MKIYLLSFVKIFEYTPILFTANQSVAGTRKPIYHTNVMMCLAETFAVICLDSIDDKKKKKNVLKPVKARWQRDYCHFRKANAPFCREYASSPWYGRKTLFG